MSYYDRLGAATDGIRTPGYVLAEMKTVDNFVAALNRDIQARSAPLPGAFLEAWNAYVAEWTAFYTENSTGLFNGWFSRAANSIYDKAMEYRAMAEQWAARYERQGGMPTVPSLPEQRKFSITPYLIGGVVVTGLVYWIFRGDHE